VGPLLPVGGNETSGAFYKIIWSHEGIIENVKGGSLRFAETGSSSPLLPLSLLLLTEYISHSGYLLKNSK
jgi:hypothetical protein